MKLGQPASEHVIDSQPSMVEHSQQFVILPATHESLLELYPVPSAQLQGSVWAYEIAASKATNKTLMLYMKIKLYVGIYKQIKFLK
jgi:hypothetical protein